MKKNITYFLLMLFLPLTYFAQNKIGAAGSIENLPPDVHFSWKNACVGDTTCFINQTMMGNTYTWTVVQGVSHPTTLYTSNDTNICFLFPGPGTYYVSLHAYNNHDIILTKPITIDTVTKADFDFIRCSNIFPNNSLCAMSFMWDFGDGNTSTLFTPAHQYADTGHYQVKLISYNGFKSDTITKTIYVDTKSYVNPLFTYTISYDTVFVHANYGGASTNYYWSFNDPFNPITNYATGKDTMHVYKDSTAAYNISLTVVNSCGPASHSDSIRIISLPLPANLTFISNMAIIPNPIENGSLNVFYNSFTNADFLVTIYDPIGRIIHEEYFTFQQSINGFKIPTADFSNGLYILSIHSENTYARRKFVVKQ